MWILQVACSVLSFQGKYKDGTCFIPHPQDSTTSNSGPINFINRYHLDLSPSAIQCTIQLQNPSYWCKSIATTTNGARYVLKNTLKVKVHQTVPPTSRLLTHAQFVRCTSWLPNKSASDKFATGRHIQSKTAAWLLTPPGVSRRKLVRKTASSHMCKGRSCIRSKIYCCKMLAILVTQLDFPCLFELYRQYRCSCC